MSITKDALPRCNVTDTNWRAISGYVVGCTIATRVSPSSCPFGRIGIHKVLYKAGTSLNAFTALKFDVLRYSAIIHIQILNVAVQFHPC
ncbi:unnamed protein product [Lasius platythorax]|uniref:Uncharacterized protein n=1 Tax=Lasius platythorax TaxID=488582 RepID=A0AAV2N6K2_9HYME